MNLTEEEKKTLAGMIIEGIIDFPRDAYTMKRHWETEEEFNVRIKEVKRWEEELKRAKAERQQKYTEK